MADGCNLYFTEKDLKDVESSIDKGKVLDEKKFALNALDSMLKKNSGDFQKAIDNKEDSRHEIVQNLLVKSLSHGQLTTDDEWKLSNALKTVLDFQKNPQGLFENPPKQRGPGADSMKHGGELLTTAALIQNSDVHSLTNPRYGYKTNTGKNLFYDPLTDEIAFGQKYPSNYSLSTRKQGTIEADTLISRKISNPVFGNDLELIAIDTKYSKSSSTYGIKSSKDFYRQLEGIRKNFNDGNLQEFYFVSNVKFSEGYKKGVNEYNIKIFKDRLEVDNELRKNFEKYLLPQEKQSYIPKEFEEFDFSNNPTALINAAKDYSVKQIELCENVNYQS